MRVNIYAEELTDEIAVIRKPNPRSPTGPPFLGIRLYLKSHDALPYTKDSVLDDDRSAITLWVPQTKEGNHVGALSDILSRMAEAVGQAKDF